MARDEDVWFEPKRIGYGAGLPVAWQGWALLGGYGAVVIGLGIVLKARHPVPYYAIVVAATLAMMLVAARHTRGGWRRRP